MPPRFPTGRPVGLPTPAPRSTAVRGPWVGVFDTPAPTGGDAKYLRGAHNGMPGLEGEWKGRPGWRQLATPPITGVAQALAGVTFGAGDDRTFAVVGGKLWQYDWSVDTWHDVTPANKVIAQPGRVALLVFAGQLVVSDGVNPPWTWDPTKTGASGSAYTATPIAWASGAWYGRPVVYYAKLFAIVAADRSAIEWSEEQSLTQGGTVGGFNNGWNLIQTSADPLVALAATNEALYFWRTQSAGRILGAVTPAFQSDGVRDAVSPIHGCCSAWAIDASPDGLWWLNQRGRLVRYAPGAGVSEAWAPMDGALRVLVADDLDRAWLARLDDVGGLAIALPRPTFAQLLVVDGSGTGTGAFWGTWGHAAALHLEFAAGAECVDDADVRRFVHLTTTGQPFAQALDRDDIAVDTYGVATIARLRVPERRGTAHVAGPTSPLGTGVTGTTAADQRRAVAFLPPRPGMLAATPLLPVPEVTVAPQPLAGTDVGGTARAVVRWDTATIEAGSGVQLVGTAAQVTVGDPGFGLAAPRAITVPAAGKLTVGRAAAGRLVPLVVTGDAERRPAYAIAPRFRLFRVSVDGTASGDAAGAG